MQVQSFWKPKLKLTAAAILLISAIYFWRPILSQSKNLQVDFFDVGQGDAILIEEPGNIQILVDGGPSNAILSKLGSEMPWGDKTIELVVITHPDKDHVSGLVDVLSRYKVKSILGTWDENQIAEYQEIKNMINEKGINKLEAQAPQRIRLAGNSYLDILYPLEIKHEKTGVTNANSIVVKLVYGQNSFLLTGDLESGGETELIYKSVDLKADVLKVGHHGSKGSSDGKFLSAVNPKIAIISVGKNNYGHPANEVLDSLQRIRAQVLRTDMSSDIILESDGQNLVLK